MDMDSTQMNQETGSARSAYSSKAVIPCNRILNHNRERNYRANIERKKNIKKDLERIGSEQIENREIF